MQHVVAYYFYYNNQPNIIMADSNDCFSELETRMQALVLAIEAAESAIAIIKAHHLKKKECGGDNNNLTTINKKSAAAKFESILMDPSYDDDKASPSSSSSNNSRRSWQVVVKKKKQNNNNNKEVVTTTATTKKNDDDKKSVTKGNHVAFAIDAPPFEPNHNNMIVMEQLFETQTQTEAVFLMGVGGRNVSLIRKYTKVGIYIREGGAIWMRFNKNNAASEPLKAWRMVLSACGGGILRWFSTPKSTQRWYSDHNAATLNAVAECHGCTLELLRSNVGHMCLMLIPSNLQFTCDYNNNYRPEEASLAQVRAMLPLARQDMLQALSSSFAAATEAEDEAEENNNNNELAAADQTGD